MDKALLEALRERRGKGVDLSIVIGREDDLEKEKKSDLAPKSDSFEEDEEISENKMGMNEQSQMPQKESMDEESMMLSQLKEGLSDYDMESLKENGPKSLRDRVLLERMKMKK